MKHIAKHQTESKG